MANGIVKEESLSELRKERDRLFKENEKLIGQLIDITDQKLVHQQLIDVVIEVVANRNIPAALQFRIEQLKGVVEALGVKCRDEK